MNTPFSDAWVEALAQTLLHSLWQGAFIALLLMVVLFRFRDARRRYLVAFGSMGLMLLCSACTLLWLLSETTTIKRDAMSAVSNEPALTPAPGSSSSYTIFSYSDRGLSESLAPVWDWLEVHSPFIVALWSLGFCFFALRLGAGLYYVARLRKTRVINAAEYWQHTMATMAQRLGTTKPVQLLESALVQTPLTLGYLKPVILLPIGIVNHLSIAEVEAVLAHELAHIARRDWVFNLVQALIEALFYYHPAIWWMSALVRSEREKCCDDAAVAATGNRLIYAKALLRLQELTKPVPSPALALALKGPRRKTLLLDRIRRILNQPQPKSQIMEKFIATVLLITALAVVGIRANQSPAISSALAQITETPLGWFQGGTGVLAAEPDTFPKRKGTQKIIHEDDKQRVEMDLKDGKITRLNIDGKDIPNAEIAQYRNLTEDILEDIAPPLPPFPALAPEAPEVLETLEALEAPEVWEVPEAPGAPDSPLPPSSVKLHTTKDKDGNTVLKIKKNGDSKVLVIKDGEVWMDGRKLENDETLDILDMDKKGFFYYNDDDGHGFGVRDGRFYLGNGQGLNLAISKEELKRMAERLERLKEEQVRELSENLKISAEEREQLMKEARENMRQAEQEIKRSMDNLRSQNLSLERNLAPMVYAWGGRGISSKDVQEQLLKDSLISNSNKFSMKLSKKSLIVNGKKQSDEWHKKYLEFYREKTGKEMSDDGSVNFNIENHRSQ